MKPAFFRPGAGWRFLAGLLAVSFGMAGFPATGGASEMKLALTPSDSVMELHPYGFGVIPLTIRVERFSGTLAYDPGRQPQCIARFTAEVASMRMADPNRQARLLGPDFMDAARYPTLVFAGTCASASALSGLLTMHGITRPLRLDLDWRHQRLKVRGQVQRGLWGITGLPVMIGPSIQVSITANLPAGAR